MPLTNFDGRPIIIGQMYIEPRLVAETLLIDACNILLSGPMIQNLRRLGGRKFNINRNGVSLICSYKGLVIIK